MAESFFWDSKVVELIFRHGIMNLALGSQYVITKKQLVASASLLRGIPSAYVINCFFVFGV